MAKDNVTPIGSHVTLPAAIAAADTAAAYFNAFAATKERVDGQRTRIFEAMGVISCAAAAVPYNVAEGDPDIRYALRAAHAILDAVCAELDPTYFEFKEIAHGQ
jgi:hypothetical protein